MLISKQQGEKICVKELRHIYGGSCMCGGVCGLCDCTSSHGEQFYGAFNPSMTRYEGILMTPAEHD